MRNRFALMLLIVAMAVRMVMPTGWMPTGERSFEITVCTGINMSSVWIDTKGRIHKSDPSKHKTSDHEPCAFAGIAMAANFAPSLGTPPPPQNQLSTNGLSGSSVSIGKGLAAPPPPSTGPPTFI